MPRHFKNWIQAYVEHTSISEAPSQFHFWTAVSSIAGALRRRVWIDENIFQWTPNFYIALVAPAGIATKSTSMNVGMEILRQVPGVHFGPQSITWQGLLQALQESETLMKVVDITGEEITMPMCAITVAASELGTFLRPQDDEMISVLTDLWDGKQGVWERITKSSGSVSIRNPWINVIGATTPAWLRRNYPEALIGEGLTSRTVFIYADKKAQYIAYPSMRRPPIEYKLNEIKLVEDLIEISRMKGAFVVGGEARAWGQEWYKTHWSTLPIHMASERYQPYRARKWALIHKVAMVIAAAETDDRFLEVGHLQAALTIIEDAEPDMLKVFESIGAPNEIVHIREIIQFVEVHHFLTISQLYTLVRNTVSLKDFEAALNSAVKTGHLRKAIRGAQAGVVLGTPLMEGDIND